MLELGILFIDGEFNEELANRFRTQLFTVTRLGITDVTLFINSYGGSVYDFLTVYGMIKSFKNLHLTTIVNGYAMSAGAYLACLGDVRRATPGSRIMLHELSSGSNGKLNELKVDMNENKELQEFLTKIVKKVIKNKRFNVNKWLEKDQYMSVKESYELGLLTHNNFEMEIVQPLDLEIEEEEKGE